MVLYGVRLVSILPLCGMLCGLAACGNLTPAVIAVAGVEVASVAVFGRGVVDLGVSAISGQDCSIVRLDRGQTYCAPVVPELAMPFCTRSLGVVDCWADPGAFHVPPHAVGDTPPPTKLQEEYRQARWPKSLNVGL